MKSRMAHWGSDALIALVVTLVVMLPNGCTEDHAVCPQVPSSGLQAPTGVVTVTTAGKALEFWPYTGNSFAGTPVDPVNLVFTGQADPVRIRAALLALDGDRTSAGFPDAYPFNATWADAIGGDVQTAYVGGGEGWVGSVVQLQLGEYGPLRIHLRLFRSEQSLSATDIWTLGAAHFEVLIPGTADHQVLSWELAKQVVIADLVRSGLLDTVTPLEPTATIHAAPTFRDIIPEIYNPLPVELKMLIGGPTDTVTSPVGIPTDGTATILHIARAAPLKADAISSTVTLTYDQVVPKPFCSEGPYDLLQINGPVEFTLSVHVGADGSYSYNSAYWGALDAVPIDMSSGEPVVGEPLEAVVSGLQSGSLTTTEARVQSEDHRLAQYAQGNEVLDTQLAVATNGERHHAATTRCLGN
jgi:hypothetical protein